MEAWRSYVSFVRQYETWFHILQCSAPAQTTHRELCLTNFEIKLRRTKTYPPLADFFYEIFQSLNHDPIEPSIANAKYNLIFHKACQHQSSIGWEIFSWDHIEVLENYPT